MFLAGSQGTSFYVRDAGVVGAGMRCAECFYDVFAGWCRLRTGLFSTSLGLRTEAIAFILRENLLRIHLHPINLCPHEHDSRKAFEPYLPSTCSILPEAFKPCLSNLTSVRLELSSVPNMIERFHDQETLRDFVKQTPNVSSVEINVTIEYQVTEFSRDEEVFARDYIQPCLGWEFKSAAVTIGLTYMDLIRKFNLEEHYFKPCCLDEEFRSRLLRQPYDEHSFLHRLREDDRNL